MRIARIVLSAFLVAWFLSPVAGAGAPLRFRDCLFQEVHAPFPAEVVRNSIPPEFTPVAYGSYPVDELVDVPTTTWSCNWKGTRVLEEWSWAAVQPPARYRSPHVDVYGFFIHGFSSDPRALASRQRRCVSSSFEVPDESVMAFAERGGFVEGSYVASKGGYTDEVRTFAGSAGAPQVNVMRMFGYHGSAIKSFDVRLTAESMNSGVGYYVQRSGEPGVSGFTISVPGYFAGDAWQTASGDIFITASGPAGCP